jgi:membrane AbrB-like protein
LPASDIAAPAPAVPTSRLRLAAHWGALVAASIAAAWALHCLNVSAALLLGAIFAAIVFAARETPLRVPAPVFVLAQALVGCMIARTIPPSLVLEIGHSWPVFAAAVGSVVLLSALLGWAMARWRLLPGTTAVWGSFPGAATAMVLMGEAYGADVRLVALMQYLRVLLVGVAATTVARLWVPTHAAASVPLIPAQAPFHALGFAETLGLAFGGAWLAARLRIPAGALLLPMFVGAALQHLGLMTIALPWWLLAACYALVGWSIGLRFTPAILRHAARLLPRVVAGICTLIVMCGGLAWLLARFAHVDPLTAYLATSPGGADTVAIIASGSPVDVPFVMAMQSARFVVVAFCGPAIARFVARHVPA